MDQLNVLGLHVQVDPDQPDNVISVRSDVDVVDLIDTTEGWQVLDDPT